MVGVTGTKAVRPRWVISNKGDSTNDGVRARLVACEVNTQKCDDDYASTPPLQAKRLLMSELATQRVDACGRPLGLSFVDVKKAYFNGIPKRRLHLFRTKRTGVPKGTIAHLKRRVCGTRDAGMIWDERYASVLASMGFKRGIASPCRFVHEEKQRSVAAHGDDFTCVCGGRGGTCRARMVSWRDG